MKQKEENQTVITDDKEIHYDPKAFDKFFDKFSAKASSGQMPPEMGRHAVDVIIYPEMCRPGVFDKQFKLGLEELDSGEELSVLKRVEGNSDKALGMELGKASIKSMNGKILQQFEIDMVWNAMSMTGRLVVGNAFMAKCVGADEVTLKKALSTGTVE